MTLPTATSTTTAICDGVKTTFNYDFIVPSQSAALLYRTDLDGTVTEVAASAWALLNPGSPAGGSFVHPKTGAALANGVRLTLVRNVPATQATSLANQTAYYPRVVEYALDWLGMQIQQVVAKLARSIYAPVSERALSPLPPAALRAGKFLTFTSTGDVAVSPGVPGPQGVQGVQGVRGVQGVQGVQGIQGVKGDVGTYLGLALIGSSTDIANRPVSASNTQNWGLINATNNTMTIYTWSSGAWYNVGTITAPSTFPVANTIYVQAYGNDANSGNSMASAVLTIERALALATAAGGFGMIYVAPMVINTNGNLDVPDNWCVVCEHRTVFVRPNSGYAQRNVFRLGSGGYVEGFICEDWQIDSLTNPTVGFAVAFRPGAVIRRVPYASKIVMRTTPTWTTVPPPLDRAAGNPLVGNGAGVILADGLVCSPYSTFANIMAWGATPNAANGIGYCAKNGGLINAINAISLWGNKHFLALTGGFIILSGCTTQFGDWTLVADGSRNIVVPAAPAGALTVQASAATTIIAAQATIVAAMWAALVAGGYTTGWSAAAESSTMSDGALFVQCVVWVLQTADVTPMVNFAKGLFDAVGNTVIVSGHQAAFIFAFNNMKTQMNALGIDTAAQTIVTDLTAALVSTISAPTFRTEPSRIQAISHIFQDPMAGVALTKIPPATEKGTIADSILETNGGVVTVSGQDDAGNAVFVGGLIISADTGALGGPPFDSAVQAASMRAAIAGSF